MSSAPSQTAPERSVAARLKVIRAGVSDLTGSASIDTAGKAEITPTWWGNGGWGRWHGWGNGGWGPGWGNGGWHNWHNWPNGGWGNGGWHNGGWGNGGWGNGGWHNYWHNG